MVCDNVDSNEGRKIINYKNTDYEENEIVYKVIWAGTE